MIIRSAALSPHQVPFRLAGCYIRATKHGLVIQKRPVKRPRGKTLLERQYRARFAFAGRMASAPTALEGITAIEMAKGTQQVPRDILTMAATGRYYIITGDNGLPMRLIRTPTTNDPKAWREPCLLSHSDQDPARNAYLTDTQGRRLLLSPRTQVT